MSSDGIDYDKYLGSTLKGKVTIKLSPMWVDHAAERGIDIGEVKNRNEREVVLETTYEQRKGILRQALLDSQETEQLKLFKRLASDRRAAVRVVRKLRAKLMD